MIATSFRIHVVDDDEAIRDALRRLFRSVGYEVALHPSADAFLDADLGDDPGCIVLDVRLPGMSGLDLQEYLRETSSALPVIVMSGHADVPMCAHAMKAGAIDFLEKPFREQAMLDAVSQATSAYERLRRTAEVAMSVRQRYAQLTPRERQVMEGVVTGRLNKQIATDLKIQEVTVKLHRAAVMRKMQAASLADLVRASEALRS